jgi:hypothetical protein
MEVFGQHLTVNNAHVSCKLTSMISNFKKNFWWHGGLLHGDFGEFAKACGATTLLWWMRMICE